MLDGDQFFDAREIASVAPAVAYWGMELDKYTNRVYFFNHLAPAETQWTPPAALGADASAASASDDRCSELR